MGAAESHRAWKICEIISKGEETYAAGNDQNQGD